MSSQIVIGRLRSRHRKSSQPAHIFNLLAATAEDLALDVRNREVALDNPLVDREMASDNFVMLHRDDRYTRGHHFRRYRDDAGYYIRMGSRGCCKRYLDRCQITYIDGQPSLFQFRLKK